LGARDAGAAGDPTAPLRLDVPADAGLGGQQLRGTLVARSTGGREPVSLVVQVVPRR